MITIFVINCLVVTIAVTIHYEFLGILTRILRNTNGPHRLRIIAGVLGAMLAHTLEIWVFALAYYKWTTGRFGGQFFWKLDGLCLLLVYCVHHLGFW